MSNRLIIFLRGGNTLFIDDHDVSQLKSVMNYFMTAKQLNQIDEHSMLFSQTFCVCMQDITGMCICKNIRSPEEDEPWKESLRPDNEEEP